MVLTKREAVASHQQIIHKADSSLSTISQQITAAQAQLQQAQEELGLMAFRRTDLQTIVSRVQEQVQKARAVWSQARTYAEELAAGTLSEPSALADLERSQQEVSRFEQALAHAQQTQAQEELQLSQRELVLNQLIAEKSSELTTLNQRRLEIQTARQTAHLALGQETYEHVSVQLLALSEQISKQNRSLVDVKLELKAARDAAVNALAPWPELQLKVMDASYESPTTRLLNTYLSFLDVLEREVGHIQKAIHIGSGDIKYVNTLELCALRAVDLQDVSDYGPGKLNNHRELIKRALAAHAREKMVVR